MQKDMYSLTDLFYIFGHRRNCYFHLFQTLVSLKKHLEEALSKSVKELTQNEIAMAFARVNTSGANAGACLLPPTGNPIAQQFGFPQFNYPQFSTDVYSSNPQPYSRAMFMPPNANAQPYSGGMFMAPRTMASPSGIFASQESALQQHHQQQEQQLHLMTQLSQFLQQQQRHEPIIGGMLDSTVSSVQPHQQLSTSQQTTCT